MIEPREFVPLRHWGYFSDILTDKRDILKGLVRYPRGGGVVSKIIISSGDYEETLNGGGGVRMAHLTCTRSSHFKALLMPVKSIFAKCLEKIMV